MNNPFRSLLSCVAVLVVSWFWSVSAVEALERTIVVANRASGTISVIDTATDQVTHTVPLPSAEGESPPEPMYVVETRIPHRVWVGDRANNRVVAFDPRTFDVDGTVPCGAGVFHMFSDAFGFQLWVVNNIDNTVTVVNPIRMTAAATIPMPVDLVDAGAVPHDVVLDPLGLQAYVTMVNVPGDADVIVAFSTFFQRETARVSVGQDPHVSFNRRRWAVYSPNQNTNNVYVLRGFGLGLIDIIDVPGAHGAITSGDSRRFYTTNLPGGGADAIFCIDTRSNQILGEPTDTPFGTPHNVALTLSGRKLYVTHSGPTSNKVTVFRASRRGELTFETLVDVGFNPFGLAFVR